MTPDEFLTKGGAVVQDAIKEISTLWLKRRISMVSGDTTSASTSEVPEAKRFRTGVEASASFRELESSGQVAPVSQWPCLLSTMNDGSVLSPLHIFVRKQVEVFQATPDDLKQPAPGRRVPIELHQVGIRCIHCKNKKARQRKKRAVCFPSSVERIYHSISDMKFAHFPCQEMPHDLQQQFAALKETTLDQGKLTKESSSAKRSGSATASTAQYYNDSARELGLINGKGGIYCSRNSPPIKISPSMDTAMILPGQPKSSHALTWTAPSSQAGLLQDVRFGQHMPPVILLDDRASFQDQLAQRKGQLDAPSDLVFAGSRLLRVAPKVIPIAVTANPTGFSADKPDVQTAKKAQPKIESRGRILASNLDPQYLAPIHCFVRKHVEIFAATEQDLSAPAPGRKKPVVLGQVGLRCVHCAGLPFKQRVKRAICFPPSVAGVYHAVSNMKFDHFKICRGMPQEARAEFERVSSTPVSSTEEKRTKGDIKSRPRVSNSTAQYYKDSAFRMGLCDTAEGIRFVKDDANGGDEGESRTESVHQSEGMQALIIAATDPDVRAAHEQRTQQQRCAI